MDVNLTMNQPIQSC